MRRTVVLLLLCAACGGEDPVAEPEGTGGNGGAPALGPCTPEFCAEIGRRWFCDPGDGQCFYGCAAQADCFGGDQCDSNTHTCGDFRGRCDSVVCAPGTVCTEVTGTCG